MSRTYRKNQKQHITDSKQKVERRRSWQRLFNSGRNLNCKVALVHSEKLFCPRVG